MKLGSVASASAILSLLLICGLTPLAPAADIADQFCLFFEGARDEMKENEGERINRLTAFSGIDVRCHEKIIEFKQSVLAPQEKLRSGWRERLQANWSSAYCKPGSKYLDALRSGWTIASTVTTSDGQEFRVSAVCNDAVSMSEASTQVQVAG
jgi:hypothetical protein